MSAIRGRHLQCPAMHGRVSNKNAYLLHLLPQVAKAQRVSCTPTDAHQHPFEWIVLALKYHVQFDDHRGFGHVLLTDILVCPRLVRQNPIPLFGVNSSGSHKACGTISVLRLNSRFDNCIPRTFIPRQIINQSFDRHWSTN